MLQCFGVALGAVFPEASPQTVVKPKDGQCFISRLPKCLGFVKPAAYFLSWPWWKPFPVAPPPKSTGNNARMIRRRRWKEHSKNPLEPPPNGI